MNETGWPQIPDPTSSSSPLLGSPQHGQSSQDALDARLQRLLDFHEKRVADDAKWLTEQTKRDEEQARRDAQQAERDKENLAKDTEVTHYKEKAAEYKEMLEKTEARFKVISDNLIRVTLAHTQEQEKRELAIQLHANCDARFMMLEATIAEHAASIADLSGWVVSDVSRFTVSSQTYTDGN